MSEKQGAGTAGQDMGTAMRMLVHDLRGPLNSMVLNLDLLRTSLEGKDGDEELKAKRQRYIASLEREIGRLDEVLKAAVDAATKAGTS